MDYEIDVEDEETVYRGFFQLNRYRLRHSLFAGGWSKPIVRECVERLRAVAVLLYDPVLDSVVLIEQFRIGALRDEDSAWLLEVVGGLIEEGESPEAVARREAMEEAGCEVQALLPVCDFLVSPGTATERIQLYCARVDASVAGGIFGLEHEGEDIRAVVLRADDAIGELYGGRVNSTSAIIAVQWLAMHREMLVRQWSS
jgi:ADP-ribose pyrophosphatase